MTDVNNNEPSVLKSTFDQLMAFRPMQANDLILTEDKVKALATKEGASGKIIVSSGGITPGMRQNVIHPAREYLAKWESIKSPFETNIHPHRAAIDSLDKVGSEIEQLEKHKEKQIQQIELRANADLKYQRAKADCEKAEARYEKYKSNEGGREAVTSAYGWAYWPAIMMIGVTEWLINYDTFFSFLSVPAIAAGATVILGILLAFAAHGHGTLLKQWSDRFGQDRSVSERRGEWRFLFLSTFSLLLVLAAAGGARYESAIKIVVHLAQGPGGEPNILGTDATVESSPLRDVLLSLLANVAAWAVGVFLAYMTHDKNLEYMRSARKFKSALKLYQALNKKHIEDDRQTEEAKVKKGITEIDASAKDRRTGVEVEYAMWQAAKARETDVKSALSGVIKHNLELYRDALATIEGLKIVVDGKELEAQNYGLVKLNYADELHIAAE